MTTARNAAGTVLLLLLLIIVLSFGDFSQPCHGETNAAGGHDNAVQRSLKGGAVKILERTEDKIRGRKMLAVDTKETEQVSVRAMDQKSSKKKITRENYGARFVAFNEDYRGPRHHPPKNN